MGALVVAVVAAYAFARWRPFRVEIRGASMRPTLEPGDWAIAVAARRVRRGDVVVIEHPERPGFEMVKRVTGVAGDQVNEGHSVAEGELWVEGDDPGGSTDSRRFGPVTRDHVKARLLLVCWPLDRNRLL